MVAIVKRKSEEPSPWIRKFRQFTKDEQVEMIRKAQAGDASARNDLVESYTPCALKWTKKFLGLADSDFDDCIQFCLLRASRAIDLFDFNFGVVPSTYLTTATIRSAQRFGDRNQRDSWRRAWLSLDFDLGDGNTVIDTVSYKDEPIQDALPNRRLDLSRLPERQRAILRMRFDGYTLEQIGVLLCVSKERIRQLEGKAVNNLKRMAGHENAKSST